MGYRTLAEQIGVSIEQVKKYEAGVNRISSSVLYDIARALRTHPGKFFQGLEGESAVNPLLKTEDGRWLARTFPTIRTSAQRQAVLGLIKMLADEQ